MTRKNIVILVSTAGLLAFFLIGLEYRLHYVIWNLAHGNALDWQGKRLKAGKGAYFLPPADPKSVFLFSPGDKKSLVHVSIDRIDPVKGRTAARKACEAMRCSAYQEREYKYENTQIFEVSYSGAEGDPERDTRATIWLGERGITIEYSGDQKGLQRWKGRIDALIAQIAKPG